MRRQVQTMLSVLLALSLLCPALGAESRSEAETAAAQLVDLGVYQGNESGDLMLDKGLTRAELATLLARLDDPSGEFASHPQGFAYLCMFADVPDWAKSPVGYAWNRGLVKGYDTGLYGAADMVTPDAACTVILRLYGHKADEGEVWNYASAADFAVGLGWLDQTAAQSDAIDRGNMAVLICRAMGQSGAETETPISTPTEDYSQQANPAVFTGYLTRGVYNTIRQAILTGETTSFGDSVSGGLELKLGDDDALYKRAEEETGIISSALAKIGQHPDYQLILENGEYLCQVRHSDKDDPILEHTQGFLDSLVGLSEREKIKRIDWYVCDRIAYDKTCYVWPSEALTQDGITHGACMSYAYSFQFLCQQADIPCILVVSDIHQWNMVYAEGRWWEVDVTADDCDGVDIHVSGPHGETLEEQSIAFDGTDAFREQYYVTSEQVLWDRSIKQYLNSDYTDIQPEITRFAKELLIPGSTK